MPNPASLLVNLAIAFGIGLLIGAERERRKGGGPARSPAGIRTFSAASLAGATSVMVGGALVLAATVAGVAALVAVAYIKSRSDDPGLTTEIALILTALLGGLSMQQPALALDWPSLSLPCSPPECPCSISCVPCSPRARSETLSFSPARHW
jgi:uncharacterized membrane protein YhiD involved in acid resistance